MDYYVPPRATRRELVPRVTHTARPVVDLGDDPEPEEDTSEPGHVRDPTAEPVDENDSDPDDVKIHYALSA